MDKPKLIVISGAGLSAESGMALFRGGNGLWNGHKISEVCWFPTWQANARLVYSFYNGLRVDLGTREPNPAHIKLAEWQRLYGAILVTQNVDDLLERAGCQDVLHLHGFLTSMQCVLFKDS